MINKNTTHAHQTKIQQKNKQKESIKKGNKAPHPALKSRHPARLRTEKSARRVPNP